MAFTEEQNRTIRDYVTANINNPAAIAAAAIEFGVSPQALATAVGVTENEVINYFNNAGVTPPPPPALPVTTALVVSAPSSVVASAASSPVQTEASTPSWDYDEYVSKLKTGNADFNQELGKLGGVMGQNAQNVYREILAQQNAGTAPAWYAGNTASPQAAAADFALRLAENGIGSLTELGQTRTVLDLGEDGGLQDNTVLFNKATGQPIPRPELLGRGTRGLDIDYQIDFAPDGTALPYTSNRQSSWMSFREDTLKPAALLAAAAYGASTLLGAGATAGAGASTGAATGAGAGAAGTGVTGMGLGSGISAGSGGLGLSTTGAAGLGINAGTGLTGTGVLSGSTLGTSLLGTGAGAAGLAGLTGTGVLSGSTLGTGLLGTTSTGALTGTGILTGSTLGTGLLGTGAGTAATVGGVGGSLGANLGTGAVTTGINAGTGISTGLGTGTTTTTTGTGTGTTTGAGTGTTGLTGLTPSQIASLINAGVSLVGITGAINAASGGGNNMPLQAPTQGMPTNTPEYYQQLQQYYNSYLPQTPRDVVTPLQQWYNSSYGA